MKPLWTKKDLMSAASASDPSTYFLKNIDGVWGVSIDDRTIKKGDLFVALIGDKFNGHDFIENAIRKGAYGIIVSDMKLANKYNGLLVKDTKKALKQIAKFSRYRFKGTTIALTGSSGKTSTKHLLASSLKKFGKTHYTQGNNNNLIGLTLTLSRLHYDYQYCVLELGMNNTGEIRELTEIAKPDIALITNVSNSHIENFKNEKEIAAAKSEIFSGLNENGIAIINSDNLWSEYLIKKAKKVSAKIHLFGHSKYANTKINGIIDEKEGSTISYDNKKWHLKYLNTTQARNAVAAISVIKELKLCTTTSTKIISHIKPLTGRGEKLIINFGHKYKTYVIDDSYNANPDSMRAALSNFYKTKSKFDTYKTVLIIGDMLELGQNAKEMHLELIPMIKKINPNLLITMGAYSKKISDKLDIQINCTSFLTMPPLLKKVTEFIKPNQLILIKGSNGTGLWKLIPIFKNLNQEKCDVA
ncbi:MAG: UDP-N-acetylmuramoyl-tripeptide--D-alanyl-D-alanine ligase [Candidatus Puniceispirillales bacterium]